MESGIIVNVAKIAMTTVIISKVSKVIGEKEISEINAQTDLDEYNKPFKKLKRYCNRSLNVLYYTYMIYIVFIM